MPLVPISLMWKRVEKTRREGILDFEELLYVGEAFLKTYTAGLVAAIADDPDRHRYRQCHKLIRANGLGDWDDVLAEMSTGTSVAHVLPAATDAQQEVASRCGPGSWLHEATTLLYECVRALFPQVDGLPQKFEGRRWFSLFVLLRNKTRGHGAPTEQMKSTLAPQLERSIQLFSDKTLLFQKDWAYVKRNLSGKYNTLPLSRNPKPFEYVKSDKTLALVDGVYIDLGQPMHVELVDTTAGIVDFFIRMAASGPKRASGYPTYRAPARKSMPLRILHRRLSCRRATRKARHRCASWAVALRTFPHARQSTFAEMSWSLS